MGYDLSHSLKREISLFTFVQLPKKSQNRFKGNERRKRHFLLRFIGQLTMDHHQFSVTARGGTEGKK